MWMGGFGRKGRGRTEKVAGGEWPVARVCASALGGKKLLGMPGNHFFRRCYRIFFTGAVFLLDAGSLPLVIVPTWRMFNPLGPQYGIGSFRPVMWLRHI